MRACLGVWCLLIVDMIWTPKGLIWIVILRRPKELDQEPLLHFNNMDGVNKHQMIWILLLLGLDLQLLRAEEEILLKILWTERISLLQIPRKMMIKDQDLSNKE